MKLTRYMLTPHFVELALSESIRKWLLGKLHDESKVDETFTNIAVPSKETNSVKEQKSLLKIVAEVRKNPPLFKQFEKGLIRFEDLDSNFPEISETIKNHIIKFAWMPMVSMTNAPRERKEFLDMISSNLRADEGSIQALKRIERRARERKQIVEETLEKLNMPKEIVRYVEALQEFIFLRSFRMEIYGQAHYYVQPLLNEIAKKSKLMSQEIKYMTHLEILDFLENKGIIRQDVIRERMIAYAFIMRNGIVSEVFAGKKAEEMKKREVAEDTV